MFAVGFICIDEEVIDDEAEILDVALGGEVDIGRYY